MTLSEEQIKIIETYPLKDLLDRFPVKLRDLQPSNESWRSGIASLLLAILDSAAALNLPAPNGGGNVAGKLFAMQQKVRTGALQVVHFRPLVDAITTNSPDLDIWAAVFSVIASVRPLTPPPSSIAPTFGGIPIRSSSSRLADSETREIVEGELFEEIKNCTFRNVGGFWGKFFDSKCWRKEQKAMLEGILITHDGKRWTDFLSIPDEKPVWDWLRSLEERFLVDTLYRFHTTRTANQFKERKGQMDLFLQQPTADASDTFWYKHVLVVGEQKKSYNTSRFKADFLTRYVQSVFADQPTRRFAYAFSLYAS